MSNLHNGMKPPRRVEPPAMVRRHEDHDRYALIALYVCVAFSGVLIVGGGGQRLGEQNGLTMVIVGSAALLFSWLSGMTVSKVMDRTVVASIIFIAAVLARSAVSGDFAGSLLLVVVLFPAAIIYPFVMHFAARWWAGWRWYHGGMPGLLEDATFRVVFFVSLFAMPCLFGMNAMSRFGVTIGVGSVSFSLGGMAAAIMVRLLALMLLAVLGSSAYWTRAKQLAEYRRANPAAPRPELSVFGRRFLGLVLSAGALFLTLVLVCAVTMADSTGERLTLGTLLPPLVFACVQPAFFLLFTPRPVKCVGDVAQEVEA